MSEYVYKPEECTEDITLDLPNDLIVALALIAHERDITLNHLLNEIMHDRIEQMKEAGELPPDEPVEE